MKPNWCKTPGAPLPENQANVYRRIHGVHCDRRGEPGHECKGKVTIDRKGITLQCPLCGDARTLFKEGPTP